MKKLFFYLLSLLFFNSIVFSWGNYPNSAIGIKAGYGSYSLSLYGKKDYFFDIITVDLNANMNSEKWYVGGFLYLKYLIIDFSYSRFYKMGLSYKISTPLSEINSSFSSPGFSGYDLNCSLKLVLPVDPIKIGIGITGTLIKLDSFTLVCNNQTNKYDYIVYDNITNKQVQDYISQNYLYDLFFNVYFAYYLPINKVWGLVIDVNMDVDYAISSLIEKELEKTEAKEIFDKMSAGFFKFEVGLGLYFRIN